MVAKILLKKSPILEVIKFNGDLEDVRKSLKGHDLSLPGLNILTLQPGVGKTYSAMAVLKKKSSYLLVTGSHRLIKNEYDKLKAKSWVSFKESCGRFGEVKKLHSNNVPIKMICRLKGCDRRKCSYWKQFRTKKAKAPYHFLTTDRVLNKEGNFKFDYLVLDESMTEHIPIKCDNGKLTEIIKVINKYLPFKKSLPESEYIEVDLPDLDDESLYTYFNEFSIELNIIKYSALEMAISSENWEDVRVIGSFNVYEFIKYYYYRTIYPDRTSFSEPRFYHILELARQGVPILLLDASFDEKAFEIIMARYIYEEDKLPRNTELNPISDLKLRLYKSHIKKPEKKIYRMDRDNLYYKKAFFNKESKDLSRNGEETIKKIRKYIKNAKRKYHNVGIITYQQLMPYFTDLGKTEYFFNLRGSNEMEHLDALFIIGTPLSPPEIVDNYNDLCMTQIDKKDVYRMTYKREDGKYKLIDHVKDKIYTTITGGYTEKKPQPLLTKEYDGYENEKKYAEQSRLGEIDLDVSYPLPTYDQQFSDSEKYQAIHRARPLLSNKPIYIFGDIPEKIEKEFTVKSYDKKSTEIYFNGSRFKGIYPRSLWHKIIENQEKGYTSAQISEKLKIYKENKKDGFNTSFVTTITKGKVTFAEIIKIDQILKEDPSAKVGDVARKIRSLKDKKEFIKYCIHYTKPNRIP